MAYCSNGECPERIATGRRQEFVAGIESCSACGAGLEPGEPPEESRRLPRMGGDFSPFPGIAHGLPEIAGEASDGEALEAEPDVDQAADDAAPGEEEDLEKLRARYGLRWWRALDRLWALLVPALIAAWFLARWLSQG